MGLLWDDQSWYNDRVSQINSYETALAGARSSYVTSLGNMYNDAMTRFTNNSQPLFANRGLQVNSGAFAQSLAYKSAEYSAQLAPTVFDAERSDLNNVNKARGDAWATMMGGRFKGADLGYTTNNDNTKAAFAGMAAGIGTMSSNNWKGSSNGTSPAYNPYTSSWGTSGSGSASNNYNLGPSWNGGDPSANNWGQGKNGLGLR